MRDFLDSSLTKIITLQLVRYIDCIENGREREISLGRTIPKAPTITGWV